MRPTYYPELLKIIECNRRAEPEFKRLANELQNELDGILQLRDEIKTPESIIDKTKRIYNSEVSSVADI